MIDPVILEIDQMSLDAPPGRDVWLTVQFKRQGQVITRRQLFMRKYDATSPRLWPNIHWNHIQEQP